MKSMFRPNHHLTKCLSSIQVSSSRGQFSLSFFSSTSIKNVNSVTSNNNTHNIDTFTKTNPTTNNNDTKVNNTSSYLNGPTTHFGYQQIPISEKELKVKSVFDNVASNYDIMNDFMSVGLHRYWKDELIDMMGLHSISKAIRKANHSHSIHTNNKQNPKKKLQMSILDVAGGTGDIAFRMLDATSSVERSKSSGRDDIQITICDINPHMLQVGECRARSKYGNDILDSSKSLTFVEGNAQCLPFENESFDLYTIAFGLRNVTDVDQALKDAYRVLKPGGRYLCLEFSHVHLAGNNTIVHPLFAQVYDWYSFNIIPTLGEIVARDRDSYQYLVESIRKFCTQEELKSRLEKAGFENVKYRNMTGGIVAIHEGWKPL